MEEFSEVKGNFPSSVPTVTVPILPRTVYARSGTTGQRLSDAIDADTELLIERLSAKLEGKTAKLKTPCQRHARASLLGGRLGGWNGYDGYGYELAGPITMARGMTRFETIREGWEILKDVRLP